MKVKNEISKYIKKVLGCVILIIVISACPNQSNFAGSKPNIIIFFTDDQGYADVGCFGAKGYTTPHLDQLAQAGIRFTNFYVPATVCTPSRAGLLTGLYPKRHNLHEAVLFPYSEDGLPPETHTMAEMLRDNGYFTSCIGKWHLGHLPQFMPNNHGFDEYFGVPYSNDMDNHYYNHNEFQSPPLPLHRNQELIESGPDQRFLTKRYTEEAIRQIKENQGTPFFIYLAHNMPHTPLHVSPDFKGKSQQGMYGDVIMELDWSVGELTKTLKQEGLYDNTIFIFTSDNGPQVGSAKPLRGKKAQTWEGGQRVPGIITWPNKIAAGTVSNEMVTTLDLLPTLATFSGSQIPPDLKYDGIDISNYLMQPNDSKVAERPFYYYARNGDLEAIRLGKWKLHLKKSIGWSEPKQGKFPISLYDLDRDIEETENLADQYPDIVRKLSDLMEQFDANM